MVNKSERTSCYSRKRTLKSIVKVCHTYARTASFGSSEIADISGGKCCAGSFYYYIVYRMGRSIKRTCKICRRCPLCVTWKHTVYIACIASMTANKCPAIIFNRDISNCGGTANISGQHAYGNNVTGAPTIYHSRNARRNNYTDIFYTPVPNTTYDPAKTHTVSRDVLSGFKTPALKNKLTIVNCPSIYKFTDKSTDIVRIISGILKRMIIVTSCSSRHI